MSKMSITEATMLALQGKLVENKPQINSSRLTKMVESIDVNIDDDTNVSIDDQQTTIETNEAIVTIDKKENSFEETTVEIPVESNETIIPEELPEAEDIVDDAMEELTDDDVDDTMEEITDDVVDEIVDEPINNPDELEESVSSKKRELLVEEMTLDDLTDDQIKELKQRVLCDKLSVRGKSPSYGELADADELISDEEIYELYGDTIFSNDDFFCTANLEECKSVEKKSYYNKKSFENVLESYYKKLDPKVESVKVATISKDAKNLKIECVINRSNHARKVCLEMKNTRNGRNISRYSNSKVDLTISTNKRNITECRYIKD